MMNRTDRFRMLQWLVIAVVLYAIALLIPIEKAQVVAWKLANVTVAAFLGYWIDRHAFKDARMREVEGLQLAAAMIRRALIMLACMIAVALGL